MCQGTVHGLSSRKEGELTEEQGGRKGEKYKNKDGDCGLENTGDKGK